MSAIKIYFCQFHDDEPTTVTVHRDLRTLQDEWQQCDNNAVGLIHIGFIRPKVLKIPQIMNYKGQVLCSAAAKWALPMEYISSQSVVFELELSGNKAPIHSILKGLGYEADEPDGMAAIAEITEDSSDSELTIANAALEVLKESSKPLSKEEIYAHIVEKGLYRFGAKKPVSVLAIELNRYSLDTDYSNPAPEALFGKAHDGKFYCLENAPQELQDWLTDLENKLPELLTEVLPLGIYSEKSYLKNAHNLARPTRDKLDMFRYKVFLNHIDAMDPERLIAILPESLRCVNLSYLGLTVRMSNVFKRQSINCLADLDGISLATMMTWEHFGRKSATDLCKIISSNIDTLMDTVSVVNIEIGEIAGQEEDNVDQENEDYLIERISSRPLKSYFESALSKLKERDREIIEYRTGYHGKAMTLQEVGEKLNVTRERIRQLQKKYVEQIIEREFWDDCIAIKIGQLLINRKAPLYLEMLESEDVWFTGFMGNYKNLAAIIELFSDSEIHIINVNGANIVTRIKQDTWDECVKSFRKSLQDKANENSWTRSDIDMTFKAYLADCGAEELLPLLWEQFTDLLHFSNEGENEKLIGFGRSAETTVATLLAQAEKPLHFSELAERASEAMGKEVSERLVHAAVQRQGAKLFGRGIYGLAHFNPISDRMCNNIRLVVTKIIYDGPLMKQWHCSEIFSQLKKQFPGLPKELDHYILNIILEDAEKLVYLNRMVWARTDSNQSKDDRVDMADAFTHILEESDGPLKGNEIKERLKDIRGVISNLQIQPTERMIQIGPDFWGLIDRDIAGTEESNGARLDALYNYLNDTQKGIHVSEVDKCLSDYHIDGEAPEAYALLNLAQRDDRFYLGKAMFLGLAVWDGDVRRVNVSQAVRQVYDSISEPMTINQIQYLIQEITGLELEGSVTNAIISQGFKYNPESKTWFK
ncbi:sigma factor-like helix-turn-helix DNA-binding protein [Amphritea pacifica]|uniref:sigma factor-like helix-turn-helix DNA-binding protein n=1 Tax=Amphritea pacifica TaxID=2811233 RepID=UPI001962342A|nr:sigma factor-like helix-turn-helix DNA-binding protein [Amphritea pacifica]MBN1009092.1 hypothetical protein [Amphritea pacifica]